MKHLFFRRGFTAIEMLTTISIIGVLSTISMMAFQPIKQNVLMSNTVSEIVSTLRTAQNKALSSDQDQGIGFGVHFDANKYTLYAGNWATATNKTEFPLRGGVSLSGTTDITFAHLSGAASNGTVQVNVGGKQKTVTVNTNGKVSS